MDERGSERQQPQEGKQNGNSGNNFGVDEALAVSSKLAASVVEIVAGQTSNDSRECKL